MDSPKENSPPKFHPFRDQQHNKFICRSISFGDGIEHHDSGYTSAYACSTTNIEHDSMSSLSATGSFHVQKRESGDSCTSTLYLEPIIEDIEIGQFVQSTAAALTPTTRNIAKINAFHITTPSSPSPVKRIASSPLTHYPLKTMRLNTTTPHKPKDATTSDGNITSTASGRKLWPQRREPLRSKLNVDDDNLISMDENSIDIQAPNSVECSPIIGLRSAGGGLPIAGVLQENKKRKFSRNASEHTLQSSTPINFDKLNEAKGNTITRGSNVERPRSFAARNNVLRKTITFSPSKHFQSVYGQKPAATSIVSDLPVLSTHSLNPARKLLDFNEDKFDTLLEPAKKYLQRQNAFETNTDYLNMSPVRHTITSAQYLNDSINIAGKIDGFDEEKTAPEFLDMSITPPKCDPMDLCSPIDNSCCVLPSPVQEESATKYLLKNYSSTDSSRQFDLLLHSDIVPESPPPSQNRSTDIVDDTQKTPKKQSYGFSVFNSTPRHEQNRILYPKLQKTPPRNQRILKRLSSNQSFQTAKRKLCPQSTSKRSFEGYEKLDILGQLEDKLPAIDSVFKGLSSQDLANITKVSKRWRRIVHSSGKANKRLQHYRRNQSVTKENVGCHANVPLRICDENIKSVRPPFIRSNTSRQNLLTSLKLPVNSPKLSAENTKDKDFLNQLKVSHIHSYLSLIFFFNFDDILNRSFFN